MSTIIASPLRFKLLPARDPTIIASPLVFALLPLDPDVFVWGLTGEREAVARRTWDGVRWYPDG
jgi:hypothetical protein